MRLEEAIEIQNEYLKPVSCYDEVSFRDAIKLGIEALKVELKWREVSSDKDYPLLPGETKE